MATTLQRAQYNVKTASGLDIIAGIWLIIAPYVLGYSSVASAAWNSVIFGIIIAVLAASREFGQGYRRAWPSWINVLIGLWLIISPFFLGFSHIGVAVWNSIIMGIVVAILAAWSALSTPGEQVNQ